MTYTAGIDVGSTYTKAVLLADGRKVAGRSMSKTGFQLSTIAQTVYDDLLQKAGLRAEDVNYVVATGFARHQVDFADVSVTDLTSASRGSTFLFPGTRTVLDIGGQTMKASLLGDDAKVRSFRLNDKCAAGTGAFLEKTAHYMGFTIEEIGPLASTSKQSVAISGVCAVFAESEVINQLSEGSAPADIMHGAMESLVSRSLQLMKRVRMQPEYTLIGGILRFETMVRIVGEKLQADVNVADGDMVQFVPALGAAVLGHQRWQKVKESEAA